MWSAMLREAYFHSAIVFREGTAQFDHHIMSENITH